MTKEQKIKDINDVISRLRKFTTTNNITSLFVSGSYCRSFALKSIWEIDSLDIISSYPNQATQLGSLFSSEYLLVNPEIHSDILKVKYGSLNIEFQGKSPHSYMQNQEVKDYLQKINYEDVPLINNLYGRDFSLNAILYSPVNDEFYDPLGFSSKDLKRRQIVSILPPDILLKYNPLAIFSAIKLATSHNLFIESSLAKEMKLSIKIIKETIIYDRILDEIVQIVKINPKKGVKLLKKFGLDKIVSTKDVQKFLEID